MWYGLLDRVENKRGDLPTYQNIKLYITKDEFLNWVIPKLENWKYPLVGTKNSPTIDRINTSGHYELANLQLITKTENTLKRDCNKNVHAPEGKAWCGKCKEYLYKKHFQKNKRTFTGVNLICKFCSNKKYHFFNKRENNP